MLFRSIVAWFSLVRKSRPGILVFCAILTSLVGTFLLVTHGNPTSLSISPAALFWGIASAFAAAFYTTYPSTLIARYGTLPVVGWSMLIGGLILLPFYARQGTNFVVNGSLILLTLSFVHGDKIFSIINNHKDADRKSTRLNSSHQPQSRMPSSA